MRRVFHAGLLLLLISLPLAAEPINYFVPGVALDPNVPTPEAYLGYQLGDRHVSYAALGGYLSILQSRSARLRLHVTGKTWEGRKQWLAVISSAENLANIKAIKAVREHPETAPADGPLVVWLGYSIHGNEASGSNAALAVAYYLTASRAPWVRALLKNSIILIDPSLNPDGYGRFSEWVNSNRSLVGTLDANDREHHEIWPQGRTNHYWFDLNRDWLLAIQPESQHRLRVFHQWHPHVFADYHEMGTNATYFFQPGVHERQNPLTPEQNFKLTKRLAKYHAKALDAIGSLYYSQEGFDDFYYGKGSTYPDINGGIGILFEQASARGHQQESVNGPLTFAFAIRNQVTTSLSTLKGALENRRTLIRYQQQFFNAWQPPYAALVIDSSAAPERARRLVRVLMYHGIKVNRLKHALSQGRQRITQGYVVSMQQRHGRLLETIFERRRTFKDHTFYDVSAWTFDAAYAVKVIKLKSSRRRARAIGARLTPEQLLPPVTAVATRPGLGYVIDGNNFNSLKLALRLLRQKLRMRVASKPFSLDGKSHPAGTLLLPRGIQDRSLAPDAILARANRGLGVAVAAITTGLSGRGPDVGSPSMRPLHYPQVALLADEGINPYQAGEMRYVLEQQLGLAVTLLFRRQLNADTLAHYGYLLLADGTYDPAKFNPLLQPWVKSGGVVVALQSAAKMLSEWDDVDLTIDDLNQDGDTALAQPFATRDRVHAGKIIAGAIFNIRLDRTHPLAWGLGSSPLTTFRDTTLRMTTSKPAFEIVARYADPPLYGGFASAKNQRLLANSLVVARQHYGHGELILFVDDPNFRGYWLGSMRLFMNSILFARIR